MGGGGLDQRAPIRLNLSRVRVGFELDNFYFRYL